MTTVDLADLAPGDAGICAFVLSSSIAMKRMYTKDVTFIAHGFTPAPVYRSLLEEEGIALVEGRPEELLGDPAGELRDYETVFRRKDGSPLHFLVNASVVHDAEGKITAVTSPFPEEGWTYGYDELHRLTSATNTSNSGSKANDGKMDSRK